MPIFLWNTTHTKKIIVRTKGQLQTLSKHFSNYGGWGLASFKTDTGEFS